MRTSIEYENIIYSPFNQFDFLFHCDLAHKTLQRVTLCLTYLRELCQCIHAYNHIIYVTMVTETHHLDNTGHRDTSSLQHWSQRHIIFPTLVTETQYLRNTGHIDTSSSQHWLQRHIICTKLDTETHHLRNTGHRDI